MGKIDGIEAGLYLQQMRKRAEAAGLPTLGPSKSEREYEEGLAATNKRAAADKAAQIAAAKAPANAAQLNRISGIVAGTAPALRPSTEEAQKNLTRTNMAGAGTGTPFNVGEAPNVNYYKPSTSTGMGTAERIDEATAGGLDATAVYGTQKGLQKAAGAVTDSFKWTGDIAKGTERAVPAMMRGAIAAKAAKPVAAAAKPVSTIASAAPTLTKGAKFFGKAAGKIAAPVAAVSEIYDIGRFAADEKARNKMTSEIEGRTGFFDAGLNAVLEPSKTVLGASNLYLQGREAARSAKQSARDLGTLQERLGQRSAMLSEEVNRLASGQAGYEGMNSAQKAEVQRKGQELYGKMTAQQRAEVLRQARKVLPRPKY